MVYSSLSPRGKKGKARSSCVGRFENAHTRGFNIVNAVFRKETISQKPGNMLQKPKDSTRKHPLEQVYVQRAEKGHDDYETPEEDGPSNRCLVVG